MMLSTDCTKCRYKIFHYKILMHPKNINAWRIPLNPKNINAWGIPLNPKPRFLLTLSLDARDTNYGGEFKQ